ncbi:MAG: PDZ domain-containing protein [Planctomycetes bacterium]|nr:PDZ domain-containing protein [Planctomycetota bacterium]
MASFCQLLLPLLLSVVLPDGWLGVYLDQERDQPVVVEVIPDSPAAKAGLLVGDVIVSLGDAAPVARERMRAALAAAKPGDRMELMVRRGDREHRVIVKLGDRPDGAAPPSKPTPRPSRPGTPPQPANETAPAKVAVPPAPAVGKPTPASEDLEAEVAALRAELAALRRQLEALRQGGGRE